MLSRFRFSDAAGGDGGSRTGRLLELVWTWCAPCCDLLLFQHFEVAQLLLIISSEVILSGFKLSRDALCYMLIFSSKQWNPPGFVGLCHLCRWCGKTKGWCRHWSWHACHVPHQSALKLVYHEMKSWLSIEALWHPLKFGIHDDSTPAISLLAFRKLPESWAIRRFCSTM